MLKSPVVPHHRVDHKIERLRDLIMEYIAALLLVAVPYLFVYLAPDVTRHPK